MEKRSSQEEIEKKSEIQKCPTEASRKPNDEKRSTLKSGEKRKLSEKYDVEQTKYCTLTTKVKKDADNKKTEQKGKDFCLFNDIVRGTCSFHILNLPHKNVGQRTYH